MFKTKLFAVLCTGASFVTAATTALALVVSGPRNTQSLHMLSENNAVAYGFTNLLSETTSAFDTVTDIVETVSDQKASIAGSFTINSIENIPEVSGAGAGFQINFDKDNGAYSIVGNASYGSMDLLKATLYFDKDQAIAEVPALFKGIITVPLDNLSEDLNNSYAGKLLTGGDFDYEEFREELESAIDSAMKEMPQYDFDYEKFYDGLLDTINKSYFKATDNMKVKDLGKKSLSDGKKYQCYRAEISVADLSYIAKDAILYVLNSDEFISFIEDVQKSMNESSDYDDYGLDFRTQLSSVTSMLDMYWSQVVTELEAILGKNVSFTIYLDNAVNPAGFEFCLSVMKDDTISFEKADIANAQASVTISADLTGGKNIGDYASYNIDFVAPYENDSFTFNCTKKTEEDGSFDISFTYKEGSEEYAISANGSYKENNPFFECNVDSLKFIENGNTVVDIGFTLSFQPIDKVEKPSGSPEYNIWEMDEDDFNELFGDIKNTLNSLEDLLK